MNERVLRFGDGRALTGVLCEPPEQVALPDAPAVLFLNAGLLHHVGPHRLHVDLARRLAQGGFRSLRFDLSGLGDSGPRTDGMPRDESMVHETRQAMDALAGQGAAGRFVLFGICTGADQAVRAALADPRVAGAVLVDGYAYPTSGHVLHYYLGRITRFRSWWNVLSLRHPGYARWAARLRGRPPWPAAPPEPLPARPGLYTRPPWPEAEARLRTLAERGCQLCCVYTPTVRYSHAGQFGEMFPSLRGHPAVRVAFLKGADHVFTLLAGQRALAETVEGWLRERFAAGQAVPG